MGASTIFLLSILLALLFSPSFAIKRSYVVYLGAHSHAVHISSADLDRVTNSHHDFLGSFLGSKEKAKDAIFYSYTRHINGFAATLDDSEAAQISNHPQVLSVFLNQGRKLHTTRSWEFLGLEDNVGNIYSNSIWKKARFGEDTIIANLDGGVWPESKSFSDEEFGPIPSKWKGVCQNDSDASFHCNRKLIGARYYNKGYAAVAGPLDSSFQTPRDIDGHGSHTLSTAGGNFVGGASVFGYGNGTAKGGSPRARVAAYKVCWPPIGGSDCFDADILAGFDMAIHDGVDVLSVSLGIDIGVPFFNDSVAIGSFHAVKRGIVVVCSAGNFGPNLGTVVNVAPWQITVGASTIDRQFPSYVILGDNMHFRGESLSVDSLPNGEFFPLVTAASVKAANASADDANLCMAGTLDPSKVKGTIVVCSRGVNARVDKGQQVALAGGVGMVLVNNEASGNEIIADPHVLPVSHISYTDGISLVSYINTTKFPFARPNNQLSCSSPMASITPPVTQLGTKPAPFMAAFSSQGPNPVTPEILKPDISAPGVSIIAAYTEAVGPTNEDFDKRRVLFNSDSGTSMSCPHVAGIVGLLKTLYPDWSPAAIRSAIMTTARTRDNVANPIKNASFVEATPFSYGAGHVNPNGAMDPGLVYDLNNDDYLSFICSLGYNESQIMLFTEGPYKCPEQISLMNFNYPSITVPNLKDNVTVTRTLKNVGTPGTYTARVVPPVGVSVNIEPERLTFVRIGEEKNFKITLKLEIPNAARDYVFGRFVWFDGKHYVRSPITVKAE